MKYHVCHISTKESVDIIRKAKAEGVDLEEYKKTIMAEVNKSMPAYSKVNVVEYMAEPFEKTPKMSIKRFMYK